MEPFSSQHWIIVASSAYFIMMHGSSSSGGSGDFSTAINQKRILVTTEEEEEVKGQKYRQTDKTYLHCRSVHKQFQGHTKAERKGY